MTWFLADLQGASLLTSSLCWPIRRRADTGDPPTPTPQIQDGTNRKRLWHFTSRDWTLECLRCVASLMHSAPCWAQVASVSPWSRIGFSGGTRSENDSSVCRSTGSHTGPCSVPVQELQRCGFWCTTCRLSSQNEEETLEPPCQRLFLVFSWCSGSCSLFFPLLNSFSLAAAAECLHRDQ